MLMLAGGNSAAWSISRSSSARRTSSRTGDLPARDLAARHDVVAPVGPAHPGLVAAVVVRRPEHQRRVLVPHLARLAALLVEPAPEADERVLLPLLADRRGVGVTGVHARL